MEKTLQQYDQQLKTCRELFVKKTKDYGTSWRVLRPTSLTDQLFIKARRIRSIEENGDQKVADPKDLEYVALVNYGVMALIQLSLSADEAIEIPTNRAIALYDKQMTITRDLMKAKNADYGEVWRDMRVSSMTDLILQKLHRVKQIEDNQGKTIVSEGLDANYQDIINYALFCLIRLSEDA